jgi:hypothetical protein
LRDLPASKIRDVYKSAFSLSENILNDSSKRLSENPVAFYDISKGKQQQTSGKKPFPDVWSICSPNSLFTAAAVRFLLFLTARAAAPAFPAGAAFSVFMIRPQRQKCQQYQHSQQYPGNQVHPIPPGAAAVSGTEKQRSRPVRTGKEPLTQPNVDPVPGE